MGGRTVKVALIALIALDAFGLLKIYFQQPRIQRPMSLAGFAVIAIKEVDCQACSIAGFDEANLKSAE